MALTKIQKQNFESLKATIEASAEGFIFAQVVDVNPFINEGLVEVNEAITDENGAVAVRLSTVAETQAEGVAAVAAVAETKAKPVVKSSFALEDDVPMPKFKRATGGALYPFEEMQIGQSFFVPNTDDKPDAAKSLGSTVSSATARYSIEDPSGATTTNLKGETVPVMIEQRKFVVRKVEGGARVWRVALDA